MIKQINTQRIKLLNIKKQQSHIENKSQQYTTTHNTHTQNKKSTSTTYTKIINNTRKFEQQQQRKQDNKHKHKNGIIYLYNCINKTHNKQTHILYISIYGTIKTYTSNILSTNNNNKNT